MSPVQTLDQSKEVFTLGELFPDGSAIECIRQNLLVLWSEGKEQIRPMVEYGGHVYAAAKLDSKLEQALQLPDKTEDFASIEDLIADISKLINGYVALDEPTTLLVASFVLSTWMIDCLPNAPCLNLWGAVGTQTTLVRLLACLCRRPLRLLEPSVRELLNLPDGLSPTLILQQPTERSLARLLTAAAEPEIALLRGGHIINLGSATVVCSQEPTTAPALRIELASNHAEYRRIGKAEAKQWADEFQPRLLRYRLSRHRQVAKSEFDHPSFAPETRLIARILGASLEGSAVQKRVVAALSQIDEQSKAERSQGLDAIVSEALLALCHENKQKVSVLEITKLANGILLGRHENQELTPKMIGAILRRKLGLRTERSGAGYELKLTGAIRLRIHSLAAGYSVLSMQNPTRNCCVQALSSSRHEFQVHQVHEVHGTQESEESAERK
jgi:hypothetical protein